MKTIKTQGKRTKASKGTKVKTYQETRTNTQKQPMDKKMPAHKANYLNMMFRGK